jgi:hypothetical protein
VGNASPIILRPIPVPAILETGPSDSTAATVQVDADSTARYELGTCDCVTGYKIYYQGVTSGAAPPTSRDVSQWSKFPGQPAAGTAFGRPLSFVVSCADNQVIYFATQVVGDQGFATTMVSASSPSIPCVFCDNDQDGDRFCPDSTPPDCDDSNASVHPGAPQSCGDGLNNDCEHPDWPNLSNTNEADDDGDGFSECAGDCDDGSNTVYPDAPEICDGLNNDCADPSWPAPPIAEETDDDADGFAECAGDCDDAADQVYPDAEQICDGVNNDCSDPDWPILPPDEVDNDGDSLFECQGDCDDDAATVFPGAPQLCDRLNNDCDDLLWPSVPPDEQDDDSDSYAECEGDCDDADSTRHPAVAESCNAIDDNCNSLIDEDELGEDTDFDGVHNLCDNCRDLINPTQLDTDQDGLGNSCDNCTFVVNVDQADVDTDGRGDGCDNCPDDYNPFQDDFEGDGVGDACDNCIFLGNPGQSDFDTDVEGDHCDLDDGLIYVTLNYTDWVEWQDEAGFEVWNLYRGDLSVMKSTGLYTQVTEGPGAVELALRECDIFDPWFNDLDAVPARKVAFYLATGDAAGVENSLGTDSQDVERPNTNACP